VESIQVIKPHQGDMWSQNCPSRHVLDRLGGKWSVLIILALASGTRRFTGLRDTIEGITPKVLTANLRDLERDGLLTRKIYAEIPPRTEYTLTPLGESMIHVYLEVKRWAESHIGEILDNREAYDTAKEQAAASR
jgi:DNA-binding HxlR family transcriptional regulator